MRTLHTVVTALCVTALVACGGDDGDDGNPQVDAAQNSDGGATPDANTGPDALAQTCTPVSGTNLTFEMIETFVEPVYVTHAPNDTRLFVVEKRGTIQIVENGVKLASPFLDITGPVYVSINEEGLLGLAFHPNYQENGRFFVHYSAPPPGNNGNTTVLAEYTVSASDPNVADLNSEQRLLTLPQEYSNHNGGMITFGPDGMLYIALGDEGQGGDPKEHGQNINTLYAAILRLDVSTPGTYASPSDNPFVGVAGADEIWAYGLRNPWRFSFDRQNGDMWIGDVGQDLFEEIDVIPAGTAGLNFGWRTMEAEICFNPANFLVPLANCDMTGLTAPRYSYGQQGMGLCSVTGGYVYRGSCMPDMQGQYFFSDACGNSDIFYFDSTAAPPTVTELNPPNMNTVTSFGEDVFGEIYVTTFGNPGRLWQIKTQ